VRKINVSQLLAIAIVVVACVAAPVRAQSPSELPPSDDFAVYGSLDVVISGIGSPSLTLDQPLILAGWAFERRSGLQPQTQRIGTFTVAYMRVYNPPFGEIAPATISGPWVNVRPDVAAAYQVTCPAVGPNTGFVLVASPPEESGYWTLVLNVATTDGAGRRADWEVRREIFVAWAPAPIERARPLR
jgi:hypothetical protein